MPALESTGGDAGANHLVACHFATSYPQAPSTAGANA
jgi:hypothetical protein